MHPLLETPLSYRLLELLGRRPGHFLGRDEIDEHLGDAPDELQRAVAALRRLGYMIDGDPETGCRLCSDVEVVLRDEVSKGLKSEGIGRDIAYHLEVSSTNDLALRAASEGAPHGAVIAAENQTAGRGRLGRRWHSPPGLGLWFSTIVRPDPVSDPGRLTLGAAVAVADAVRDVCGVDTHLVWPNDVWVAGHKLAGILTETRMDEASIDYAAVGVGVNVNHTEDDFPEEVRDMATSLKIATGRSQPRSGLLRSILEALEAVLDLPPARIRDLWRDRSAMWGRRVQITGGSGAAEGVAEDLDVDGGLRIRSPGGELVAVHTGEVERLRVARS